MCHHIVFVATDPFTADMATLACITALSGTRAFPMSLRQAFALTLKMSEKNRRLMRDFLTLSAEARAFRMAYRKGFMF